MHTLTTFLTTKSSRRSLGYYSMFISLGMNLAVLGPTLPALAEQTGTRLGLMGSLFLAGAVGYVIGTLIAGFVFDRFRGHPMLGGAGLVSAAMLALVPFAHSFPLLLMIIVVRGIADGMINTGISTLLLWTHGEDSPPFVTGLHFTFGVGAFLSPLIVARILEIQAPIGTAYWLLAGISMLMSLRMMLDPGSPDPEENNQNQRTAAAGKSQSLLILLAALILFFYVGAEITFGGWLYSFAVTLELTSEITAAYLTSAFYLAFTIGRLVSIPLTSRFSVESMITTGMLACLATLVLGTAFHTFVPVLWGLAIGTGLFMAPVFPAAFSLAGKSIHMNARASSRILLGDSFGSMLLPWLAGLIIEAAGPGAMLFMVTGSLILSLVVFAAFLYTHKRSSG